MCVVSSRILGREKRGTEGLIYDYERTKEGNNDDEEEKAGCQRLKRPLLLEP
jgi:hypothetical protein